MKKLRFQIKKILILSMVVINLLPFFIHDIYADTLSSANLNGFQVNLIDTSFVQEHTFTVSGGTLNINENNFLYNVNIQLDDYYLGYAEFRIQGSYYTRLSSGITLQSFNHIRKVFINGNECNFSFLINALNDSEPLYRPTDYSQPTLNIENSDITKLADIDSLQQIIDILTDLYNSTDQIEGLLSNQLTQLQNIVANTSLANQYLDNISKLRNFSFPIESFSAVYTLTPYYINEFDIYDNNYWKYPIFTLYQGDFIVNKIFAVGEEDYFIFACNNNIAYINTFNNNFISSDGSLEFSNYEILDKWFYGTTWNLIKMKIKNTGNRSRKQIILNNALPTEFKIIPIYINSIDYLNLSTEFALQYGLSNKLLDNLNIIAQGTTQSNQSASNLEQSNTTLETSQNQMFSFENQQNQNMNNALNQIDTNFNIGNVFGSSFLASADWVRTQFNLMTGGNVFGSVLSFSLLLGLSLLIIGKVLG